MKIRYAAKTDVGMKRTHNEDYFSLIEDEANVDARRAAAGLQPLAAYVEEFRRSFESPADGPSPSS